MQGLQADRLITVLEGILQELKESNRIAKEGNESFYKEQQIIEEQVDDAIGHAKNTNNNLNAIGRRIQQHDETFRAEDED